MKETGERYTAARQNILNSRPTLDSKDDAQPDPIQTSQEEVALSKDLKEALKAKDPEWSGETPALGAPIEIPPKDRCAVIEFFDEEINRQKP